MAVRLDFYSVIDDRQFDPSGPHEAGWVGFVAASDADERELIALLEACAIVGALIGAVNQGAGTDAAAAIALGEAEARSPLSRTWLDVIGWSAEIAAVRETRLGWLTRYDRGGSSDDGAEEWKTSWSDAPTEGTGADQPWPPG
ncbi:MAG: hypothetical protein ABIR32_14305 [Ilumatobacteraceae bacterium]